MAKLEKRNATKVWTKNGLGQEHILGYYKTMFNAEREWSGRPDVHFDTVEVHVDHETDKVYVLRQIAPNGRFLD